jgi:hypothetical protein
MEPLIDMRIEDWTHKLNDYATKGEAFDFSAWAV